MRTFNEYLENRENEQFAALIVEAGLDPIEVCGFILETAAQCSAEEELYTELWGGLRQLGGAMAGAGASAVGTGANALGRGMAAAGRGVRDMAGQAAGAIGRKAQAVGSAIGTGAQAVGQKMQQAGQWAADQYQSGEMIAQMQQATKQIEDLRKSLEQMGFASSKAIQTAFNTIYKELQAGVGRVQSDRSMRFGPGSQVFGKKNVQAPATP